MPALEAWTTGVGALEAAVDVSIERGKRTLFLIATGGNTINGVFDPIANIGAIDRTANVLFHMRACWGGAAAVSDNLRHPNKGSELADSIAFNPSKNVECATRVCLRASKRTVGLLAGR